MRRKRLNNTDCTDKFIVEHDWVKKYVILKQPQIKQRKRLTHVIRIRLLFLYRHCLPRERIRARKRKDLTRLCVAAMFVGSCIFRWSHADLDTIAINNKRFNLLVYRLDIIQHNTTYQTLRIELTQWVLNNIVCWIFLWVLVDFINPFGF